MDSNRLLFRECGLSLNVAQQDIETREPPEPPESEKVDKERTTNRASGDRAVVTRQRQHIARSHVRARDDATSSPSTYEVDVPVIESLLAERTKQWLLREYDIATEIRDQLKTMGVTVYDKERIWTTNPHRRNGWMDTVPSVNNCNSVLQVLELHGRKRGSMTPTDISFCWNQIAQIVMKNERERILYRSKEKHVLFQPLLDDTTKRMEKLGPKNVVAICHKLAKLVSFCGLDIDDQLWVGLEDQIMKLSPKFHTKEISSTVWALATAKRYTPCVWIRMEELASQSVHHFNPQGIANTVWAYAEVGHKSPELFNAFADEACNQLHHFSAQGIYNIAWSYAKANQPAPKLFTELAKVALPQLQKFSHQGLTKTLWSYATLGHAAPVLFQRIAEISLPRISEFSNSGLVTMLGAYPRANHTLSTEFYDTIAQVIISRIARLSSLQISNALWSFATVGHFAPDLFRVARNETRNRINEFNSHDVANTLWSYARAGHHCPDLLNDMAKAIPSQLDKFNTQDITNTVWAYAALDHSSPQLFSKIAEVALPRIAEFNPRGLANTLWAFVVTDDESTREFTRHPLVINAVVSLIDRFDYKDLCQLHQWDLWCMEHGNGESLLPPPFSNKCLLSFVHEDCASSNLQRNIAAVVSNMNITMQEDVRVDSGYSIDILLTLNDTTKVAIEVDGPNNYLRGTAIRTGATRLKNRQIMALDGLTVVSIPFWEWHELPTKDQMDYLKGRLKI